MVYRRRVYRGRRRATSRSVRSSVRSSAHRTSRPSRAVRVPTYAQPYVLKQRKRRIASVAAARKRGSVAAQMFTLARMPRTCSFQWLKSLMNPFSGPVDACNPFTQPLFTERVRAFCRFNITTAANAASGTGDTIFMTIQHAPDSGTSPVRASNSAAWTVAQTLSAICASTMTAVNSPLAAADIAADKNQWAIVSRGIRLYNCAKVSDINGYVTVYEQPSHQNVLTVIGSAVKTQESSRVFPIPSGGPPLEILWGGPRNEGEMRFSSVAASGWTPDTAIEIFGTSINIMAEYFINFEFTGTLSRGSRYSEQDDRANMLLQDVIQAGGRGGGAIGGTPSFLSGLAHRIENNYKESQKLMTQIQGDQTGKGKMWALGMRTALEPDTGYGDDGRYAFTNDDLHNTVQPALL